MIVPEIDMATDDTAERQYFNAQQAQLGERVTNLGRRQTDLENEMRSGFRQIEQSFASFTNETRSSINTLGSTLAERNKPQWQALGVMLAFATALGGLAYWPILEATKDLKASVAIIADKMVTQKELEWRSARSAEDRARLEGGISDLRSAQVPRAELERVWQSFDQRFSDHQRQLDDVKQAQGSVYGQRDIILDLRERLDRVERQRIDAR
jgi:hypothetical protein